MITVQNEGKVVFVTGGTSGIGAAICKEFAKTGAKVCVNFRSHEEDAIRFVESLKEEYKAEVVACKGDMSKPEDVKKAFDIAYKAFGQVDILINNAGKNINRKLQDVTLEEWGTACDANVNAMFLTTQEYAKRNIAIAKGGRVVNVLSKAAFLPTSKEHGYYVMNKTGEWGLTKSTACELVEYGIYVNAVIPGFTKTPATDAMGEAFQKKLKRAPLHRFTEPEELAEAINIIANESGKLLVGSIIDLSGGLLLGF